VILLPVAKDGNNILREKVDKAIDLSQEDCLYIKLFMGYLSKSKRRLSQKRLREIPFTDLPSAVNIYSWDTNQS
jgi:hypothetical protein